MLKMSASTPPVARRKRRGTSRSTVVDVARLAQVAQSTVSLFFREPSRVSKETAGRIRAASDELGYLPNPAEMSLATARSRVVGVVLPSLVCTSHASPPAIYHGQKARRSPCQGQPTAVWMPVICQSVFRTGRKACLFPTLWTTSKVTGWHFSS